MIINWEWKSKCVMPYMPLAGGAAEVSGIPDVRVDKIESGQDIVVPVYLDFSHLNDFKGKEKHFDACVKKIFNIKQFNSEGDAKIIFLCHSSQLFDYNYIKRTMESQAGSKAKVELYSFFGGTSFVYDEKKGLIDGDLRIYRYNAVHLGESQEYGEDMIPVSIKKENFDSVWNYYWNLHAYRMEYLRYVVDLAAVPGPASGSAKQAAVQLTGNLLRHLGRIQDAAYDNVDAALGLEFDFSDCPEIGSYISQSEYAAYVDRLAEVFIPRQNLAPREASEALYTDIAQLHMYQAGSATQQGTA